MSITVMRGRTTLPLLFVLLFTSVTMLHAQDDGEYPARNRRPHGGIVGVGAGFVPTWVFAHTADVNAALGEAGFPALPTGGMMLYGAQLYGYIIVVENLRVGGLWYGGSMENSRTRNGMFEQSSLSTESGGFLLEYVVPFRRLHLAAGAMVGWGNWTLAFARGPEGGASWADLTDMPPADAVILAHRLQRHYTALQPQVTVEYDLHPFVVLGLTGGYYGSIGGTWEADDAFAVSGMPSFSMDGAFVRASLTVGLFLGEW
jgi:hypothetical protein